MADVTSMNEEDWGPEQSEVPPIGSIFILCISKRHVMSQVSSGAMRYRLTALVGSKMRMDAWRGSKWCSGYAWSLDGEQSFRVLRVAAVAQVQSKSYGCHCAKCGNHFPFAEPNQADGSLVCWNCRHYPHYQGRL